MRKRIAVAIFVGWSTAVLALAVAQEPPPTPSPTPAASASGGGKASVELTAGNPADMSGALPIGADAMAPVQRKRPAKPGEKTEEKGLDFIAAPIPISNPTFGTGLAAIAAILFPISKKDEVSPPTTIGVGGLWTDNHTWAFGAAGRFYLAEDHWRVLSGAVKGELHYNLSPAGTPIGDNSLAVPIRQDAKGLTEELLRRVTGALFVGAKYTYADTMVNIDAADESESAPSQRDRSVRLAALGLRLQTDTRDSTFFPTEGKLFDFNGDFYEPDFGGTRTYQSYKGSLNVYRSIGERGVLAARVSACNVRGDAPVYALCLFGSQGDLRGYEIGRYLNRALWAVQAEYRWNLPESLGFFGRFALVGFAGVGEVARSFSDLSSDDLLPGGGVGVRYLLSKENHINFRIDWAWGRDGNKGVYVGVGEAF